MTRGDEGIEGASENLYTPERGALKICILQIQHDIIIQIGW